MFALCTKLGIKALTSLVPHPKLNVQPFPRCGEIFNLNRATLANTKCMLVGLGHLGTSMVVVGCTTTHQQGHGEDVGTARVGTSPAEGLSPFLIGAYCRKHFGEGKMQI